MDIVPVAADGRQMVESYGGGRFRVSGALYQGSVLVQPDATQAWPVEDMAGVTFESLAPLLAEEALTVEVILLGCGAAMAPVSGDLRQALRSRGIGIEPMDTGAACRTYNVLLSEQRLVAAALIAVE